MVVAVPQLVKVRRTAEAFLTYEVTGVEDRLVPWGARKGEQYRPMGAVVRFKMTDRNMGTRVQLVCIGIDIQGKRLKADGTPGVRAVTDYLYADRMEHAPQWARDLLAKAEADMVLADEATARGL